MTAANQTPPSADPSSVAAPDAPNARTIAITAGAEAFILLAAALRLIGPGTAFVLHLLVVMGCALAMRAQQPSRSVDASQLLALILIAVAGFFGAIGALVLPVLSRRDRQSPELLSAWYERIALSVETDALTKSSDHIAIGRSADLGAPPPEPYSRLFTSGSVADRQNALGMIARHFHPDYLPALSAALASPDAVVRVQAAAVAAKILPDLETSVRRRLDDLDSAGTATSSILEAVGDLKKCAASGLLPETEVRRIRAAAAESEDRALTALEVAHKRGRHAALAPAERALVETRLVTERRFAELRAMRLLRRDRYMRRYRWRPFATVALAARGRAAAARAWRAS